MAFGLGKPLVFILSETDTPRLPNTAKRGYPMFALERVQNRGFRTLALFCSYLAADWRSTVRLYATVLALSLPGFFAGIALEYLVSILATLHIVGYSDLPKAKLVSGPLLSSVRNLSHDPPTLCMVLVTMALLLIPYVVLLAGRFRLRARIRRAAAGEVFSESLLSPYLLSNLLSYSLAGADLLKMLYRGDVHREHEVTYIPPKRFQRADSTRKFTDLS
jgi:hypothetical protein